MDKFHEKYNLSTLTHERIENLKRPIMSREIESVVKKLPMKKKPGPDGYTGELYQTFIEL